MKKGILLLFAVILTGVVCMGAAVETSVDYSRTIRVSGEGEVITQPDVAFVSFGVETLDADSKNAQGQNSLIMSSVMKVLQEMDIKSTDIKTVSFSINPKLEHHGGISKKIGYQAQSIIRVKLTDLNSAGRLIDAVTGAGANLFYGIEFAVLNKAEQYDNALKDALNNARQKAELIAQSQGVKVGGLFSVVEHSTNNHAPLRAMAYAGNAESMPVASGVCTIRASIEAVYYID